jgi:DNA-binding SARP family transcriptional activator
MGKLRLQLLGAFRLKDASGDSVLFPTRKSKALLSYLALAGEQRHSRSVLANLLWTENSEKQARESLRQALTLLRKALHPAHPIVSEGDAIAFDASLFDIDAVEFSRLAQGTDAKALTHAAELYGGELLEGLNLHTPEFERWLMATRQSYHEIAVELFSRLLADEISGGNFERATSVATRLLALDPLRESSHRALMELYGKQGRYTAALRQYQICAELLARELDVAPETATTTLYRQIRALRNAPRSPISEIGRPAPHQHAGQATSQTAPALEQRQITVLCGEISGLDTLAATLAPEELVEIAVEFRRRCAEIIKSLGGHIEQLAGNRFFALFGFPNAYEHSAEQAIRAGLAINAEWPALHGVSSAKLTARVGIATSSVIAVSVAEDAPGTALELIGTAPSAATFLQTIAPPNAILIAEETKKLVKGLFECAPFAASPVSGSAAAGGAWQVFGVLCSPTRFRALHRDDQPLFVGRDDEIEDLVLLWRKAKQHEGRIAFVTGEPGIGKSRLALEFQKQIAREPHAELLFQCSPIYSDSPLHPFIAEVERTAALHAIKDIGEKRQKLRAWLADRTSNAEGIEPLFAKLLSISSEVGAPAAAVGPQQLRRNMLAALLDHIESFARQYPLFIVFEDYQWADASSVELLDLLADRIRGLPVLLLVTSRPGLEPAWGGLPHVREVLLDRIGDGDARMLVQNVRLQHVLPASLIEQIVIRTDGNPLFVEEMTQATLERRVASGSENDDEAGEGKQDAPIPATLQDLLADRLDGLGEAKTIAQVAAVIGRNFSEQLLRNVIGATETRLGEQLERLVASGLVFEERSQSGRSFAFKHALVRDAAYQSLLKGRRQQLHATIANTICKAIPTLEKSNPELVARHLTEAGMIMPALGYWLKAGVRAFSSSANREAIAHLERGLELVPLIENLADRKRWERQLLAVIGPAVMAVEGYAAAKSQQVFEKAWALIDEGCPAAERLRITCGLWNLRSQQGELAAALPLAQEFRSLSQASNLGVELGNCMMGINLSAMGNFEPAHHHLMEVVESFRRGPQTPAIIFGVDEHVLAHCYLARVLWSLGYPEKAARIASEGFALSTQGASSVSVALAYIARLFLSAQNPEDTSSEQLIAAAMAHAIKYELPPFQNWFTFFAAAIRLRQGHAAEALPLMQACIANADARQNWLFRPFQLGCVAEAYLQLGDVDRALANIETALATADITGERQSEANLFRVKAKALAAAGRVADADDVFRAGIAVARRQKARMEELRLALTLVAAQQEARRAAHAGAVLANVYRTFSEGFHLPELRAARAVLERAGLIEPEG